MSADDPYLAVARIAAAHGVRGEVSCELITDFPERFHRSMQVYAGSEHRPLQIERVRPVKDGVLLKLAGIDTRDDAERMRGILLFVPETDAVELPEGSYYWHQIVGMEVHTVGGELLGTVEDILPTGSNDVYVVRGGEREVLLPAIHDVVRNVDLENGVLTVELMEGLL